MWKLLAPGVGLGDFLTPVVVQQHCVINLSVICGRSVVFSGGILSVRASKRNFAWRNKTALGPRGQTETSLKIEYLRSNKTTGSFPDYKINVADDQQPEFRCLSEFYIIMFLNKLKIVENTKKGKKKSK